MASRVVGLDEEVGTKAISAQGRAEVQTELGKKVKHYKFKEKPNNINKQTKANEINN